MSSLPPRPNFLPAPPATELRFLAPPSGGPSKDPERDWDRDRDNDRSRERDSFLPEYRDRRDDRQSPPRRDWERHDNFSGGGRRGDWDNRELRDRRGDRMDYPLRADERDNDIERDRKRRRSPSPTPPSHLPQRPTEGPPLSSRPRFDQPPNSSEPMAPDPEEMTHVLPRRHWDTNYLSRHRNLLEPSTSKLAEEYEEYKKRFASRQLYALHLTHMSSQWYIEAYSPEPEYVELRARVRRQAIEGRKESFLKELDTGTWDTLDFDLPAAPASSAAVALTEDDEDIVGRDDTVKDGTDGAEVGDAQTAENPDSDGDIDVVDSDSVEQSSASKPTITASTAISNSLQVTLPIATNQIFIKAIATNLSRKGLEAKFTEALSGKEISFTKLSLSIPNAKKSWFRVGWIDFPEGTDMNVALSTLDKIEVEGFKLHMCLTDTPITGKKKTLPSIASTSSMRLRKDLEMIKKTVRVFDEEEAVGSAAPVAEGWILDKKTGLERIEERVERVIREKKLGEEINEIKKMKYHIDLISLYLRKAFLVDYYSASVGTSIEDLSRKNIGYLRSTTVSSNIDDTQADIRWATELDKKLKLITSNRGDIDPADYGGKNQQAELRRVTESHIKKEEEAKFRCLDCNKVFKAVDFVIKHLVNKHSDTITGLKELDVFPFFNNFCMDPYHIQPATGFPAAVHGKILAPPSSFSTTSVYAPSSSTLPAFNNNIKMGGASQYPWVMMNPMLANMNNPAGQQGRQQHVPFNPGFVGFNPGTYPIPFIGNTGQPGNNTRSGGRGGRGGRASGGLERNGLDDGRVPLTIPVQEDPRAKKGRVSYLDLDEEVAKGEADGSEMLPY